MPTMFFVWKRCASAMACCMALGLLSGCASGSYYQPSENSASSQHGITVYGEIDTSVVRTR